MNLKGEDEENEAKIGKLAKCVCVCAHTYRTYEYTHWREFFSNNKAPSATHNRRFHYTYVIQICITLPHKITY